LTAGARAKAQHRASSIECGKAFSQGEDAAQIVADSGEDEVCSVEKKQPGSASTSLYS
jgi:hypothetical protein